MPDMTEAKKIVKRYFHVANRLMLAVAIVWLLGAILLFFVGPGAGGGWKVSLMGILLVMLALLFVPVIRQWRVIRRDCKNGRLLSKKTRITCARYRAGYGKYNAFSAHIVDGDSECYRIFLKKEEEALALESWLTGVPATIEYLEGSRIATTVCLEVSPHAKMPSSLTFLFEEREGYTRFIKGKKKENI